MIARNDEIKDFKSGQEVAKQIFLFPKTRT